jgi:hypothetical protein
MSKIELGSTLVKTVELVKIDREMQFSDKEFQERYKNSYLVGYLTSVINHLTENNPKAEKEIKDKIAYLMSEVQ